MTKVFNNIYVNVNPRDLSS